VISLSRLRLYTWIAVATTLAPIAAPAPGGAAPYDRELARIVRVPVPAAVAPAADTPQPAAKSEPRAEPPPPKNLEPLPPGKYTGILGQKVAGPDGDALGLVVDVVVDVDGTPRAAIIDFGGFLGVGSRKIAVDWRLLNFAPDRADGRIWLSLDRAEIQAAPEYRPDATSDEMVGPPWAARPSPAAGK
jgi:PRC-barrel domain